MSPEKKVVVKKLAYQVNDELADKIREVMKNKNKELLSQEETLAMVKI